MTETTTTLDRARVIAIAGDIIDECGLERFTMTDVSERAGVTQPALYRHVDNVADLWRGLGLATRADLAAALMASMLGRVGTDAVVAVARAWRTFALEHPGRYRSTERTPVAGDAELEAAVAHVHSMLALSMRGFDLDAESVDRGALMIRSVLHGFVSFELGDGNAGQLDADESFEAIIRMLCVGLDAI